MNREQLIAKVKSTLLTAEENLSAKYKVSETIDAFETLIADMQVDNSMQIETPTIDVQSLKDEHEKKINELQTRITMLMNEKEELASMLSISETFCSVLLNPKHK